LSGSGNEWWPSVDIDDEGNVFIDGGSPSENFPVTDGAYDTDYNNFEGCADITVTKFTADISEVIASTFVGSRGDEWASAMRLNKNGEPVLTGYVSSAYSNAFMSSQSYSRYYNGGICDGILVRLSNDLSTLLASTYIGGDDDDTSTDMAFGTNGDIYVSGKTESTNLIPSPFSVVGYQSEIAGGMDAYVMRFDENLSTLKAATFIGGSDEDRIQGLQMRNDGLIVAVGRTTSSNFPTTDDAYDNTYNGGENDNLVQIFDTMLLASTPELSIEVSTDVAELDEIITFENNSLLQFESFEWTFGHGAVPYSASGPGPHDIQYKTLGSKTVTLEAYSPLYGTVELTAEDFVQISLTDIKDINQEKFFVYPNVTSSTVNVEVSNGIKMLSVYNTVGRVILEKTVPLNSDKITLDISDFADGLYFIEGTTINGKSMVKKIIKK
jgi:hypothetical protein